MIWISAADELPIEDGPYFIIDLRYNQKRIAFFNKSHGHQSLFYRIPKQILWGKEAVEERNARILKESQQHAKNAGGFYLVFTLRN